MKDDREPCSCCRQCGFGYHCSKCTAAWRERARIRSLASTKTRQRAEKKQRKGT